MAHRSLEPHVVQGICIFLGGFRISSVSISGFPLALVLRGATDAVIGVEYMMIRSLSIYKYRLLADVHLVFRVLGVPH